MTTAPFAPRTRWGVCFALIATLHVGAVVLIVFGPHALAPVPPPPPAVMIDLPPMPAAPAAPPKPVQKQTVSHPRAAEHVEQPVAPRVQAAHIDVPVPPRPKIGERVATTDTHVKPAVDAKLPAPAIAAQAALDQPVAAAAAPASAATAPPAAAAPSTNAVPTWQGQVLGRLERFKRYPAGAQQRRQQGVVYLRFSMDRRGNVVTASIEQSSGVDALDQETLALIHRAEPLPAPPIDVTGDPIQLVVPIQFFLTGR